MKNALIVIATLFILFIVQPASQNNMETKEISQTVHTAFDSPKEPVWN